MVLVYSWVYSATHSNLRIFSYVLLIYNISSKEMFIQILYPFNCWFLYILDIALIRYTICSFLFLWNCLFNSWWHLSSIKIFKFWWSPIFCFLLLVMLFGVIAKKLLLNSRSWSYIPMFLLRTFMVLGLIFRWVVHFELSLCMVWGTYRFNYIHLYYTWISAFLALFVEKTILSPVKLSWHSC